MQFVPEYILKEINRIFKPKDVNEVIESLKNTMIPPPLRDGDIYDRVWLAIIYGSKGDIKEFRRYLAIAQIDYRDVLQSSGLIIENWGDILIKNGFKYYEEAYNNEKDKRKKQQMGYIFEKRKKGLSKWILN